MLQHKYSTADACASIILSVVGMTKFSIPFSNTVRICIPECSCWVIQSHLALKGNQGIAFDSKFTAINNIFSDIHVQTKQ